MKHSSLNIAYKKRRWGLLSLALAFFVFFSSGIAEAAGPSPENSVFGNRVPETETTAEETKEVTPEETEESEESEEETTEAEKGTICSDDAEADRKQIDNTIPETLQDKGNKNEKSTGSDKTQLINSGLTAKVMQEGTPVEEGGKLLSTKGIQIGYQMSYLPLAGDNGIDKNDESTYLKSGDYILLPIPPKLETNGSLVDALWFGKEEEGGIKIGDASLHKDDDENYHIKIVFTNEIDNEGLSEAAAYYAANMKYAPAQEEDKPGEYPISIRGKNYYVIVPEREVTISGKKTGEADLKNKVIHWKIQVKAVEKDGGADGDLSAYSCKDVLGSVGDYVPGSFYVGKNQDGSDKENVADNSIYDETAKTLSYAFARESGADGADTCKGERWLFFQTRIPENKLTASGEQTITNNAAVYKGQEKAVDFTGRVRFERKWITKEGEAGGEYNSSGNYDPANRKIKWTITVNQAGESMNQAVIEDNIPEGLELDTNTIRKKAGDESETAISAGEYTNIDGKLSIKLGNITRPVTVTFETKVKDTDPSVEVKKFRNTAVLAFGDQKYTSNTAEVAVGIEALTKKKGKDYDAATHTLSWNVTADVKGQNYTDLWMMELLVYGGSDSLKAEDLAGMSLTEFDAKEKKALNAMVENGDAGYYQQLKKDSFSTEDTEIKHKVILLEKDGKAVADVLIVSGNNTKLSAEQPHSFAFETVVTNPNYYASNEKTKIYNKVALWNGSVLLRTGTGTQDIQSSMLAKDMLGRDAALKIEQNPSEYSAVNSISGTDCFDYINRSVVFRIYVNANNITDVTEVITPDGTLLGRFEMTDELPEGWEFHTLAGEDFLLYKANGKKAEGLVTDASSFPEVSRKPGGGGKGESLTFTFRNLEGSYVILLKAGPKEETAVTYFTQNNQYQPMNHAILNNDSITATVKADSGPVIKSRVLNKKVQDGKVSEGELVWEVEYRPYGIPHAGNVAVIDVLPDGVELRTDSSGTLLTEGNIHIYKLSLLADGTYAEAGEEGLTTDNFQYDRTTRTLRFIPPDKSAAYRFHYVTDITGPVGEISNNAQVVGMGAVPQQTEQKYSIDAAAAGAVLKRSGWIRITKKDGETPLAGAEFTLFSKDGSTEIRKAVSGKDGTLMLKAIPEGEYILRETKAPYGYSLSARLYQVVVEKIPGNLMPVTRIDNGGNELEVQNHKLGTVGSLTVGKLVAGNAGETGREFSFTLSLKKADGNPADGSYSYSKGGSQTGTLSDGDSFTLSHGQSITILDLPGGMDYVVQEQDYSGDGYTVSRTGETGTIAVDTESEARFVNTRNKLEENNTGGNGNTGSPGGTVLPDSAVTEETQAMPSAAEPEGLKTMADFVAGSVPDPSLPDSPSVIRVWKEDGSLLGEYTRSRNPDGTWDYRNAYGEVLGESAMGQTGDSTPVFLFVSLAGLAIFVLMLLFLLRKKKVIGYYYD